MSVEFASCSLINIDSAMDELPNNEVTADLIDTYVCTMSFKNFDFLQRRIPFVLDLKTNKLFTWHMLVAKAKHKYWLKQPGFGILVFDANEASGFIRTYRFSDASWPFHEQYCDASWIQVADEATLYSMLDSPVARSIYDAWFSHRERVTELPTTFVNGRHANTNVTKSIIFSMGEGCVGCGGKAVAYAATTVGRPDSAVLVSLPVCAEHFASAKEHPSVLHFLASIFHLSLEWDVLIRSDSIPDELIPVIHDAVAADLGGTVGIRQQRDNGWFLTIDLPSGWCWKLRIRSLTDFAYLLYDPNKKGARYQADSAPHHIDVPFFPNHQHSRPDSKKKDEITPSFLYGHPLLDLKRLKDVGREYGAYCTKENARR